MRHWPDGSYRQTVTHPVGALELERMELLWRAWRVWQHLTADQYDDAALRFLTWFNTEPEAPQASISINNLVAKAWRTTFSTI